MDTYFAKRDADYLPVPPLLISTSGLESYLESLSKRLGRDIVDVKHQVEMSSRDVTEACLTVTRVKRFLATKAMAQMESHLSDTFTNDEAMEEVERDFERAMEGYENVEQPDVFSGMLVVAKKLVKENEALKRALADSTSVITVFNEQQIRMTGELATINQRLQAQQRDFHQLSLWLGTYDREHEQTTPVADRLPQASPAADGGLFEDLSLRLPSESEVDTYVAHSPLLLSLRRLLLRDLSERVTSSSENQSKEVGELVAELRKEMSRRTTTDRAVNAVEDRRTTDSQSVVSALDKRLKEVESHYVRREQLASSLKTKADTLLLPVKADSAEVTTLERKVFDKYADLEERVAYFEAEREEFRKTLHTIVSLMPSQGAASDRSGDASVGVGSSRTNMSGRQDASRSSVRPRDTTTLRDMLEASPSLPAPRQQQQACNADEPLDPRPAAATQSGVSSIAAVDGKQVYRVIGAHRSGFATSARAAPSDTKTCASLTSKKDSGRNPSPPPKNKVGTTGSAENGNAVASPPVEAIGMTANQAAYAQFVTRELNRGQVESLPPLPYEKLLNPQP